MYMYMYVYVYVLNRFVIIDLIQNGLAQFKTGCDHMAVCKVISNMDEQNEEFHSFFKSA